MDRNFEKIIDISTYLSGIQSYTRDPAPESGLFFSLADGGIANVGGMKHRLHHGTCGCTVPFQQEREEVSRDSA